MAERLSAMRRELAAARNAWLTTDEAVAYLGLPSRKALYQAVRRGARPPARHFKVDVWLTQPDGRLKRFRKSKVPTREQAQALEAKVKAVAFEGRFFEVARTPKLTVADMRKGEVLKLRRDQLDLRDGCPRLGAEDTKTDRPRNVYLTTRTLDALRALPWHVTSEFVFVNPRTGKPWDNIRRMWRRACKAAGLPEGVWFHDTRRSFCTNARRRQVPESVVSEVMRMSGHRTRSVFDRYNIVEDEDVRQAVRQIEAGRAAERTGRVLDTSERAATGNEEAPSRNP